VLLRHGGGEGGELRVWVQIRGGIWGCTPYAVHRGQARPEVGMGLSAMKVREELEDVHGLLLLREMGKIEL